MAKNSVKRKNMNGIIDLQSCLQLCKSKKGLSCNFLNSSNPFFKRGGNYNNGSSAGVFYSNNNNGNNNSNNGFRVALPGAALRYTLR